MIVRITGNLEKEIKHYSKRSGLSKKDYINQAVEMFINDREVTDDYYYGYYRALPGKKEKY